jgi:hypothetical protein
MAKKKSERSDLLSFWIPAAVIVAVTIGGIVWMESNKGAAHPADRAIEAEKKALEVQPLIPKGKIVAASWRERAADVGEEEIDFGESMLDSMTFEDMDPIEAAERKNKAAESLKKTVDRIHGLAVHVAPAKEAAK